MAIVFGTVFKIPFKEYASYLFIGSITWEVLSSSVIYGGGSFQSAAQYIKLFNHRLTIYSLKSSLVYITNYLIANIGIFIWFAITNPKNIPIGILTLPLTTLILFSISWSIGTVIAYVNVKYRDYQQVASLFMQALWYLSPGFLQESMFNGNPALKILFRVNPVTHIFFLQRKPLLSGVFPSAEDYLFAIGIVVFFTAIAYAVNKRYEKSVIFYLQ